MKVTRIAFGENSTLSTIEIEVEENVFIYRETNSENVAGFQNSTALDISTEEFEALNPVDATNDQTVETWITNNIQAFSKLI